MGRIEKREAFLRSVTGFVNMFRLRQAIDQNNFIPLAFFSSQSKAARPPQQNLNAKEVFQELVRSESLLICFSVFKAKEEFISATTDLDEESLPHTSNQ